MSDQVVSPSMNQKRIDLILLALGFLLGAFWILSQSIRVSSQHLFPYYDEVAYLNNIRTMHQQGPVGAIAAYLKGTNREDNRHPLYMMVLSLFSDGGPTDFTRAKLFSAFQCVLALALLMLILRIQYGTPNALAGGLLFSFAAATVHLSQFVLADILFALIFFLTCWHLIKSNNSSFSWCINGFLCALAYLTKGNGLLLIGLGTIVGIATMRRHFFKPQVFGLFYLTFVLTAGFLMWRNLIVWHNPFHQFNTRLFWLNGWEEYFFYQLTPEWEKIGAHWYFQHHSVADAVQRFWRGGTNFFLTLLESLSFVSFENPARYWIGGGILLTALIGWIERFRQHHLRETLVSAGGILLITVPFSFYIEQSVRFVFPIVLLIIPFAAVVWGRLFRAGHALVAVMAISTIYLGVVLIQTVKTNPPTTLYKIPDYWRATTDWIEAHVDSTGYALDSWSPYSEWYCCQDKYKPVPYKVKGSMLMFFMKKNHVHLALVDRIQMADDPYKEKYGETDLYGPLTFLGWPRLFHDTSQPSHFLMYGFLSGQVPAELATNSIDETLKQDKKSSSFDNKR